MCVCVPMRVVPFLSTTFFILSLSSSVVVPLPGVLLQAPYLLLFLIFVWGFKSFGLDVKLVLRGLFFYFIIGIRLDSFFMDYNSDI